MPRSMPHTTSTPNLVKLGSSHGGAPTTAKPNRLNNLLSRRRFWGRSNSGNSSDHTEEMTVDSYYTATIESSSSKDRCCGGNSTDSPKLRRRQSFGSRLPHIKSMPTFESFLNTDEPPCPPTGMLLQSLPPTVPASPSASSSGCGGLKSSESNLSLKKRVQSMPSFDNLVPSSSSPSPSPSPSPPSVTSLTSPSSDDDDDDGWFVGDDDDEDESYSTAAQEYLIATAFHRAPEPPRLPEATPEQLENARMHYRSAVAYAKAKSYNRALDQVNRGLGALSGCVVNATRNDLLQLRANVHAHLGNLELSLLDYKQLLEDAEKKSESSSSSSSSPSSDKSLTDRANLLYACGRLCTRLKRYPEALSHHAKELQITSTMVGGKPHMAISKIYHELARICKDCMLDPARALEYWQGALAVETQVLREAAAKGYGARVRDLSKQVQKTKQSIGRCHFEMGDVQKALQTTFVDN